MAPTFTRILVPIDFGAASMAAYRTAVSLARSVRGSIHLLHVAKDPFVAVSTPELYGIDWTAVQEGIARETKARLTALAETAVGITVTSEVVTGRAANAIIQVAEETSADLIVMGTHGRGGLGHLLLGSVAERVIRLATCPVMTVRDSGAVHIRPGEAAAAASERSEQVTL